MGYKWYLFLGVTHPFPSLWGCLTVQPHRQLCHLPFDHKGSLPFGEKLCSPSVEQEPGNIPGPEANFLMTYYIKYNAKWRE